ncbi:protein FAM13A isoform X1 [Photinus pyralis]|uniref:FAM13A-like domain-containing protein n=3 Tax=Photinus pyralis TaxID=7054 RepID=A0A1Y1M228_PHOPY|nr:protein FAM13A isoform X1 [Photinus pyralis]
MFLRFVQCSHMVDQDVMKTSTARDDKSKEVRKEQETRFGKVKRMITDTLRKSHSQTPTTFEEAKSAAKARKRKERQESIGSISQERKVIRSNSEERPIEPIKNNDKKDMRRVVSHEDFQKAHPLQEHNDTIVISLVEANDKYSPPKSIYVEGLVYDDYEHERRRWHERFAPAMAQRGRRLNHGRKYKSKHVSKHRINKDDFTKENGVVCTNNNDINRYETFETRKNNSDNNNQTELLTSNHQQEKDPSPSPVHTPVASTLDLTTLHQQIDSSEPMPSSSSQELTEQTETLPSLLVASNRLLSSPRNSIMITNRIYLDPNVQQTKVSLGKDPKTPMEKKLKQLSKQINSLKRKIKNYDEEFQQTYGYKSSQADKMNDKNIRKLYTELNKFKREYKQLKGDTSSTTTTFTPDANVCTSPKPELNINDTLAEIEKRLSEKRITSERSVEIEDMTNEQIIDEKIAIQKALLYLEFLHGRPSTKGDRDLVRPLYDRYRTLKRMMAKISLSTSAVNELATIHEHETMDFVSSTPQTSETETDKFNPSASTDSDTDISLGESFHTLTLNELLQQQQDMNEEKKKLRRSLKEFENEMQTKTGRKLQKDDKILMSTVYSSYKKTKAKLRLLDALIAKQKT